MDRSAAGPYHDRASAKIVISMLWVVVGFSLAFGDDIGGGIGDPRTFFMFRHVGTATHPGLAPTIPLVIFALFILSSRGVRVALESQGDLFGPRDVSP
jgi:Amt family ammonium transporter